MATKSQISKSKPAMTMAELLAKQKSSIITPHKGEMLDGTITKLTPSEILVDINAKTEAVVLEKDSKLLHKLLLMFKMGDKVKAQVLNPESDSGNSVVSLRRFIGDLVWEKLKNLQKKEEPIEVTVDTITKGGFLVTTADGTSGFLPNSHVSLLDGQRNLEGKKIKVVILELNRDLRKIIFSQRKILGIDEFQKLTKELKIGQKIDANIVNVTPFGLFTSIPLKDGRAIEGFVHISEASWDNISNMSDKFSPNQKITAIITGFDREGRRINLSIKRLSQDMFDKQIEEFPIDKKLKARVVKNINTGVLLDFGKNVMGIIKKEKLPPNVSYSENQEIDVIVSLIDKKRQRVIAVPVLLEKPIGYR